jgi:hypothetical protein
MNLVNGGEVTKTRPGWNPALQLEKLVFPICRRGGFAPACMAKRQYENGSILPAVSCETLTSRR